MSRLPRFFVPGLPLHVIQRGNDRQRMFAVPADYAFYRGCVTKAARQNSVAIHAYALMGNHVHFLVTPDRPTSLPKMMQSVGRVYVRWFNTQYSRTGTLFEGRYKAAIVDHDNYLFACMRYIELNPVRAGIVARPVDYRWSSVRANAYGRSDELVQPHALFNQLGDSPTRRQAVYRKMFGSTIAEADLAAIRDATQNAWALGGEAFRARVGLQGRRPERLAMGRPRRPESRV